MSLLHDGITYAYLSFWVLKLSYLENKIRTSDTAIKNIFFFAYYNIHAFDSIIFIKSFQFCFFLNNISEDDNETMTKNWSMTSIKMQTRNCLVIMISSEFFRSPTIICLIAFLLYSLCRYVSRWDLYSRHSWTAVLRVN